MSSKLNSLILLLTIVGIFLSGCQKEVTEIIDPSAEEAFNSSSTVADLVNRTSLNDGSDDNIIDGSSCTQLVLPITVIVNGLEITLDSKEDFNTVEHIIDQFSDDDDVIEILFPVTVILADHSELQLNNKDDLEDLVDQCTEGGMDDDIECIDFKFPLDISLYDSENQLSDVITIDNDKEMHDFIDDLDDNDVAGFVFPITVVLSDGTEMQVNDNDELEDVLKSAINDCDEDDDNDHNDDDVDDTELKNILLEGQWEITYFFDDEDETGDFAGYIFTFLDGGVAKAQKGDITTNGSWYANGDDGALELQLNFGSSSPLDELEDDWDIIEFDGTIVKLRDISGGDGSVEYLTFERPSGDGGDGGNSGSGNLSDIIIDGEWIVANYNDSGNDETIHFNGYDLNFVSDGTVTATNGDVVLNGTWSVQSSEGVDKLVLDFGENVPFNEFNDDWDIIDVKEGRIELKDVSGGDGSTSILVFEKK